MAKMLKDFFGGHRKLPPAPPKPDYRGAENGTRQVNETGAQSVKDEDQIYLDPVYNVNTPSSGGPDHVSKSTKCLSKSPKAVHYSDVLDTSVALLQFKAVTEELNRKRLSSGTGLKKGGDKHDKLQSTTAGTGSKIIDNDDTVALSNSSALGGSDDRVTTPTCSSNNYDDDTGSSDSLLNLRFSPTLLTPAQIMQQTLSLPYHGSTSSCNMISGSGDIIECPTETNKPDAIWLPGLKDYSRRKEAEERVTLVSDYSNPQDAIDFSPVKDESNSDYTQPYEIQKVILRKKPGATAKSSTLDAGQHYHRYDTPFDADPKSGSVPPSEDVRPVEEYDEPWEWSRKKRSVVVSAHGSTSKLASAPASAAAASDEDARTGDPASRRDADSAVSPAADDRPEDEYDVPWEWRLKQQRAAAKRASGKPDDEPSPSATTADDGCSRGDRDTRSSPAVEAPTDEYDLPWEWKLKQRAAKDADGPDVRIPGASQTKPAESATTRETELSPTCIREFDKLLDEYDVPWDWRVKEIVPPPDATISTPADATSTSPTAILSITNSTTTIAATTAGESRSEAKREVSALGDERPLDEYDVPWEWQVKQRALLEAKNNARSPSASSPDSMRARDIRDRPASKADAAAAAPPSANDDLRPEDEYDIPWELLRKQHRTTLPGAAAAAARSDENAAPPRREARVVSRAESRTESLCRGDSGGDIELHISEESDAPEAPAVTIPSSNSNSMLGETLRLLTEMDMKSSAPTTEVMGKDAGRKPKKKTPPKKPPRKDRPAGERGQLGGAASAGSSKENSLERNSVVGGGGGGGGGGGVGGGGKRSAIGETPPEESAAERGGAGEAAERDSRCVTVTTPAAEPALFDTRPLDDYDAPWEWMARKNSEKVHSVLGSAAAQQFVALTSAGVTARQSGGGGISPSASFSRVAAPHSPTRGPPPVAPRSSFSSPPVKHRPAPGVARKPSGGVQLAPSGVAAAASGDGGKQRPPSTPPPPPPSSSLATSSSSCRYSPKTMRSQLSVDSTCSRGAFERVDATVPLQRQPWYHRALSRQQAEELLRVLKEGSYLVRTSESNRHDHSLSIKSTSGFMHMKIVKAGGGQFILGQFSKPFDSIPEMIHFYTQHKLPIRGAEHMSLAHPVMNELL